MHSTKGAHTQFTILRVALQLLRLARRHRHLTGPQMYRRSRAPFALLTAILVAIGGSFCHNSAFLNDKTTHFTPADQASIFCPVSLFTIFLQILA